MRLQARLTVLMNTPGRPASQHCDRDFMLDDAPVATSPPASRAVRAARDATNLPEPIMKRLPPSPFAPTLTALLMMCATLLFSLNASAQNRGFDVRMDTLSLERDRGQLVITYQIDSQDWRALQQARIEPRLNIYLPEGSSRSFEFQQALRVDSPRGQASINLGPRAAASHAELRLVGTQGRNTITTMRLASMRPAQTLRLPIVELRRAPERPGRVDRDDRYDRDDRPGRPDRYDRDDRRPPHVGRPPHAGRPQPPGPPPHAGRPHQPGPPPYAGPSRPAPTRPGASRAEIINACGQQSPFSSAVTSCIEN